MASFGTSIVFNPVLLDRHPDFKPPKQETKYSIKRLLTMELTLENKTKNFMKLGRVRPKGCKPT